MLGTDHSYYWAHRMMHEVNIIWATHQDWIFIWGHILWLMTTLDGPYDMDHMIWTIFDIFMFKTNSIYFINFQLDWMSIDWMSKQLIYP